MGTVYLRNTAAPDATYQNLAAKLTHPQLDNNFTLFVRNDVNDTMNGILTLARVDSSLEGGSVNFLKAIDNSLGWEVDCFGSSALPNLRFVNYGSGSGVEVLTILGSGNHFITSGTITSTYAPNAAFVSQDTETAPFFFDNGVTYSSSDAILTYAKIKLTGTSRTTSAYLYNTHLGSDSNQICGVGRIDTGDANNYTFGTGAAVGAILTAQTIKVSSAYNINKTASARYLCVEPVSSFAFLSVDTSTLRIKMDVQDLSTTETNTIINSIRPTVYYRKKKINGEYVNVPDYKEFGFIAEEVAQIHPSLATYESVLDENGNFTQVPDGLVHANFLAPGVAALQMLKMSNNSMRARIEVLKEEIEALKIR